MKVEWCTWESLPDGKLKSYGQLFSKNAPTNLIENVNTKFRLLRVNDDVYFPVTINNDELDNSFVCSPFTAYSLYSKDEINRKIQNKIIKSILLVLINVISKLLKSGEIDKNVHVNNFLLSTNPYPQWSGEELLEITNLIKKDYPKHAIIFRSLNTHQHNKILLGLTKNEYQLIGSRQIYMFDLSYSDWLKRRNNKYDIKLIKKEGLDFIDHSEMKPYLYDALKLYQQLYLMKYSKYNPKFTLEYFNFCYENEIILFQGYKDVNNTLKAFSGLFILGNTITSPLVGYDTHEPQKKGLYIHAAQLALKFKFETNLMLNLSSGAPKFKRMRGGQPVIEYSALYIKHLSLKRRLVWGTLKKVSNRVGVPLLKKYKL